MKKRILNSLVAIGLAVGFSGCGTANVELVPSTSLDGSKKGYVIRDRTYHSSIAIKNRATHLKKDLAHSLKVAAQMTKKDSFKYFKITHPKRFANELKKANATTPKQIIEYCFDEKTTNAYNTFLFGTDAYDINNLHCNIIFGQDTVKKTLSTIYRIEMYNNKDNDGIYYHADNVLNDTYIDQTIEEKFTNDDVEYFEDNEDDYARTCVFSRDRLKGDILITHKSKPLTPKAKKYCYEE